jgi:DNA-binding response OmpR family regulator/HPt (histidine-containing phosphotransfer) domain-containing protein
MQREPTAPDQRERRQRPAGPPAAADLVWLMREARQKFIVRFQAHFETMQQLLLRNHDSQATDEELRGLVHRLAGLAGTMGFPTVSERASALEAILEERADSRRLPAARQALESIRDAFTSDLTAPPTWSSGGSLTEGEQLKVFVVDDDPQQRSLMTTCLMEAGHDPIAFDSGRGVLDRARTERPSAILLDVNMPEVDGYATCQSLKGDAETRGIPVVFMTTRAGLNDKLIGLSLGADDYLCKPVDGRELLLRLRLLTERAQAPGTELPAGAHEDDPLPYQTFVMRARPLLTASAASVVVLRIPDGDPAGTLASIREDIRRRDLIGWYDDSHLALLFPDMSATDARSRWKDMIRRLPAAVARGLNVGITCSSEPGARTIESLLADAFDALTGAHTLGEEVAVDAPERPQVKPRSDLTIVVVEDDADVAHILDAHIQAAGYRTVMASDGEAAIRAVDSHAPAAMILDLMLPKMTGFDVLQTMKLKPGRRPPVLVLSARNREHDVTRAFQVGASDYMVKPFSPQELLARIARLLK